ncbi:probable glutamate carboxypeptidase LAMP1 [Eucalyptus grandis]|uniref:probable glutamate carboxypeptidase LAMP1 n=1 Tax=Eucalyptus grandis TaxID=71139 RepID=UPI0008A0B0C3|nr:probable glutamate carboxypeptidase LAMP1 [Eucalyptus grandis]
MRVRELNDRLMMAERAFADPDGLFGRSWYKHLIYGPSKHNDYGSKSFPGIDDAIEEAKKLSTSDSWHSVQHEIWRVSRAVKHMPHKCSVANSHNKAKSFMYSINFS